MAPPHPNPDPPQPTTAFVLPFVLFLSFLILPDALAVRNPELPWWRRSPELWVYPLQTITCLSVLAVFWKSYVFRPFRGFPLAVTLGIVGIAAWITPSLLSHPLGIGPGSPAPWPWLGFTPRPDGFDPTAAAGHPATYAFTVAMRVIRMAVCVPLIEEIFWRGFLMRAIADPHRPFHRVPFGSHSWPAFLITTAAFVAVHNHVDYIGAAIFGSLTYFVAVRTKSLAACVLMHALANLALAIYILTTRQWGFW